MGGTGDRRAWAAVLALVGAVLSMSVPAAQTDGRLMFVGTYTAGTASKGIYAFRFDDRTGGLTPLCVAAETPNPSFLATRGDFVFAVNETSTFNGAASGSVTSFSADRATGRLTQLSVQPSRGTDPCHLAIHSSGKFLAVANYSSGSFAVLPVGVDGRLAPATMVVQDEGSGPNRERQEGPHAHQVVFAGASMLYGVDLGTDRIMTFAFNPQTGALTAGRPPFTAVTPGAGPRHMEVALRHAFAINELNSTITRFTRNAATGELTAASTVSTLPADFSGTNSTAEIAVDPTGRFLYASNRGHDSIAVFSIGRDGTLTLVEHESTRGQTPRHFAFRGAGWLIAANQNSNTIAVFAVDRATGALTPTGPLVDVPAPVSILFHPRLL